MEAIQTQYKGHRFRSRLEARWAVFFEACGAEWEYEPEGFNLDDNLFYLPDFKIRHVCGSHIFNQTIWVEVKGDMDTKSADKILHFTEPIYIVGAMPDGDDYWDVINKMGSIAYDGPAPLFYNFDLINGDCFGAFPGISLDGFFGLFGHDGNYLDEMDMEKTWRAYTTALGARFEHGETPKGVYGRSFGKYWKEIEPTINALGGVIAD